MLNRLKFFVLLTVITFAIAGLAQSAPAEPETAPAPEVAPAPQAPAAAAPAAHAPAVNPTPVNFGPSNGKHAQVAPAAPLRYYQLDYVVKEVEGGKVANSRAYSIILAANGDGRREQIRTGSRVPVVTQESNTALKSFQYIDLGVSIDSSNVTERPGQLSLRISADISSLGPKTDINQPIIRQNRWESNVTVPIGKAVTVFSSDDVASTRAMQLELKATPIK